MKRPEFWHQLPYDMKEDIVNRCELDYCHYESSRVEAAETLLREGKEYSFHDNFQSAQNYYMAMTDKDIIQMAKDNLASFEHRQKTIQNFLDGKEEN